MSMNPLTQILLCVIYSLNSFWANLLRVYYFLNRLTFDMLRLNFWLLTWLQVGSQLLEVDIIHIPYDQNIV